VVELGPHLLDASLDFLGRQGSLPAGIGRGQHERRGQVQMAPVQRDGQAAVERDASERVRKVDLARRVLPGFRSVVIMLGR